MPTLATLMSRDKDAPSQELAHVLCGHAVSQAIGTESYLPFAKVVTGFFLGGLSASLVPEDAGEDGGHHAAGPGDGGREGSR